MNSELENIIIELYGNLYNDKEEKDNIDELTLKKNIFRLIRAGLKEKIYEIFIGNYELNIAPKNLSVKYDSEQTIVEVSNDDVYYETTRDLETRFFCISQVKRSEYLMDTPLIRVTGTVTNMDGVCEEHYMFELYTDEEDEISNYISLPSDTKVSEINLDRTRSMMVYRKININDPRTDVIDFFTPDKVVPVYLDTIVEKYKAQPDRKEYNPNNYTNLLPSLTDKKRIIRFIYGTIVEYYSEYLKENQ